MSDFLVLGLVPGTHFVITFVQWLVLTSALAFAWSAWRLWRSVGFCVATYSLWLRATQRPRLAQA